MASMVFDGLYIFAGAVLGLTIDDVKKFNPIYTVLITVGLMLTIYLITFIVRLIIKRRRQTHPTVDVETEEKPEEKKRLSLKVFRDKRMHDGIMRFITQNTDGSLKRPRVWRPP